MTAEEGAQALKLLEGLQIRFIRGRSLLERAFSLAAELDQPTVCDTAYLASAEKCGCDLWTADGRFARTAAGRYPQVRLVYGFC